MTHGRRASAATRRDPTAEELHARAVLESEGGRPVRAGALLRQALERDDARDVLRVRILVSLALAESEEGDLDRGLTLLDEAAVALAEVPDERQRSQHGGLLHGQRGLLLLRAGRYTDAVTELDTAADQLAWSPMQQARALLNRGTAALLQGDLPGASHSLDQAARVAAEADWDIGRAKATGNLGYLALLAGDLPAALRLNDESAAVLVPVGSGVDGVTRVIRARILMAAGLLSDAETELRAACSLLQGAQLAQDRAEAELSRAQVALTDDRPGDATRWARQASRRFTSRGAAIWALQCDLIQLQANRMQRRHLVATADSAASMVEALLAEGLSEDARVAELIRLDCLVAAGRRVPAPALQVDERIGTRLLARAVRADRAQLLGDHGTAAAERARGLVELHRYQARFGSLDLQSGASGLGRRLAADGLAAAVRSGRPRNVLAWSERARATTSRTPPLRPPADPVAAELLAELRFVRTTLHDAALARRDDEQVRRFRHRRRELERTIRRRSWYSQGHGSIETPARPDQVRAALVEAPGGSGALVSYLTVGHTAHALVVTGTRAVVQPLGDARTLAEQVQRVRADLDLLALTHLPPPVRGVAMASLRRGLQALETLVLEPLTALPDAGPVLIVPCAEMAALPWTSLDALRRRPVTVAPSATWWLSARQRGTGVPADSTGVFVAGPDVERGPAEIRAAAEVWPGSTVLTGTDATGVSVLQAADGVPLWHIAAHGQHDRDNPLFSSIQLSDGALFGYDLDTLGQVPKHVVLSACDLGLATVRRRDEAIGMTAALLHGGAVSVVAGMARVSDQGAFEVGVRLHRGLRAGLSTAQALADALADVAEQAGDDVPPAPLVCLGAGW